MLKQTKVFVADNNASFLMGTVASLSQLPQVEIVGYATSGSEALRQIEALAPDVFVFDEPTHGIDVQGKEDVYAVMDELANNGKAVLFISSEFNELLTVCDRLVVMRDGVSVAELEGEGITEDVVLQHCYPETVDAS